MVSILISMVAYTFGGRYDETPQCVVSFSIQRLALIEPLYLQKTAMGHIACLGVGDVSLNSRIP